MSFRSTQLLSPSACSPTPILDASKRGDTVLDSFLGSGSTLLACDEVGRRCFGVEIDPLYVDVAVRRWQRATRRDAIFEDTGETFDERAARRAAEAADLETSGSSADTKASSVGITTNNIVGSAAHD